MILWNTTIQQILQIKPLKNYIAIFASAERSPSSVSESKYMIRQNT
jgi:hypothetical protein